MEHVILMNINLWKSRKYDVILITITCMYDITHMKIHYIHKLHDR